MISIQSTIATQLPAGNDRLGIDLAFSALPGRPASLTLKVLPHQVNAAGKILALMPAKRIVKSDVDKLIAGVPATPAVPATAASPARAATPGTSPDTNLAAYISAILAATQTYVEAEKL